MRTVYLLISVSFLTLATLSFVQPNYLENGLAYAADAVVLQSSLASSTASSTASLIAASTAGLFASGKLRDGMTLNEVIAQLGAPQGKLEMETRRELRVFYPKYALKFIEGRLVHERAVAVVSDASPVSGRVDESKKSISTVYTNPSTGKKSMAGNKGDGNKEISDIKLEAVLNEVMHAKPSSNSNGNAPSSTRPMSKVVPLRAGIPGSPFGASNNGIFGQEAIGQQQEPGSEMGMHGQGMNTDAMAVESLYGED